MGTFALFYPKGVIALAERNLMVMVLFLMLIVVIPAYILLFTFARKYRAGNPKNTNAPEDNRSSKLTFLFWLGPVCVVCAISLLIWHKAHALDPFKPIASDNPPITIEVVALQWKWLFIYPKEHIATVNFIQVPVNTPINFYLTADAPMNSMWIPELGGQMYAMPGMSTQLHLMATAMGDFRGSAAEISGAGFSGMTFVVRSSSQADFENWIDSVKQSPNNLNLDAYTTLAKPSENVLPNYYSSVDDNLYDTVIMKFMAPTASTNATSSMDNMSGMDMNNY
jgi:cytochrome o ubiquinol oxidase subunit 2